MTCKQFIYYKTKIWVSFVLEISRNELDCDATVSTRLIQVCFVINCVNGEDSETKFNSLHYTTEKFEKLDSQNTHKHNECLFFMLVSLLYTLNNTIINSHRIIFKSLLFH